MTYSPAGLEMTRFFEGCRLTAYRDSVGVLTLGYGHTAGVKEGDTCTQEQADAWLAEDTKWAVRAVTLLATAPLTQCQFDALVDFAFNLGSFNLCTSTLLEKLNAGDYSGAAADFPKWNKVRINGVLTPSPGLTRRRLAEKAMFEGKDWR